MVAIKRSISECKPSPNVILMCVVLWLSRVTEFELCPQGKLTESKEQVMNSWHLPSQTGWNDTKLVYPNVPLRWAWQMTSWRKRKRRIFTRLRHEEENVLHILQGGTGKQQLARDENKMLGDEEIRNTKELELIKSRIKALFFEKLNWFKQDQW